jgi:hypothetical protein
MDTITNQQTINNAHNVPFMTHVFLIIYVFLCIMVKKRCVQMLELVVQSLWTLFL